MDKCENCAYYKNNNTYEGTGYCELWDDFTKDDDICDEYWG